MLFARSVRQLADASERWDALGEPEKANAALKSLVELAKERLKRRLSQTERTGFEPVYMEGGEG